MKNPRTPNLRAQVAGEVAMEAHPAPAPLGQESGVSAHTTHWWPVNAVPLLTSPKGEMRCFYLLFPSRCLLSISAREG